MKTLSIFSHDIGGRTYEVWVTNGIVQYAIDGAVRHDIESVSEFLVSAAKAINRPSSTDDQIVKSTGSIGENALENYQNGAVAFDAGATSPSISLKDGGTQVEIGGSGVGGKFRVDFGSGSQAEAEAALFQDFANDLLGGATATVLDTLTGVQIGNFSRTIKISERDDDITQIKFKSSGDSKDLKWADLLVEQLASGGTRENDGKVSETTSLNPAQVKIVGDGLKVDLGSQGVGGKEVWSFDTTEKAEAFRESVLEALGPGASRSGLLDDVIEQLADDMGAATVRDGRVSDSYEARQIRLIEKEGGVYVDLGNHKVGGRERYDFGDESDSLSKALEFIGTVRELVGVEAREGRVVDNLIFKVSGGAGLSGSPTFVGVDAFIEYIGEEFGGDLIRDGSVSESFGGGGRLIGDGTDVQLGPRGVGGREVWDFDTKEDAEAFLDTLDHLFG